MQIEVSDNLANAIAEWLRGQAKATAEIAEFIKTMNRVMVKFEPLVDLAQEDLKNEAQSRMAERARHAEVEAALQNPTMVEVVSNLVKEVREARGEGKIVKLGQYEREILTKLGVFDTGSLVQTLRENAIMGNLE